MNKKEITLLIILTIITNIAFGQTKSLYVVDTLNKVPIQSAVVQSEDLKFNQITDENGFVNLTKLPKNINTIVVHCVGYETKSVLVSNLNSTNQTVII